MNNIDLNEKEKKIMAGLYKLGTCTVGALAKETLINRTTLYPIMEKLLEKGLVTQVGTEEKSFFKPISTKEFKDWVIRRKEEANKTGDHLLEWIKSQDSTKRTSLVSDIRYYEGLESVKSLYADTWRNNESKQLYCITDYKGALDAMSEFFLKDYLPTRVKHGISVKNIVPESEEGRKAKKTAKEMLREFKFIKIFENLEIEINIYDDKTSIVAFDKEKPSGVLIKNEKIASAMKNIFEYLWKTKG